LGSHLERYGSMLKKNEYLDELEKKMEQLNFNVETLRQRLGEAPEEIKTQYEEQIIKLQAKINVIKEARDKLQEAEENAWEDIKTSLDSLWHDLDKTYENIKNWIKSKML